MYEMKMIVLITAKWLKKYIIKIGLLLSNIYNQKGAMENKILSN